jgi:Tfp pilus assembly protein PilV
MLRPGSILQPFPLQVNGPLASQTSTFPGPLRPPRVGPCEGSSQLQLLQGFPGAPTRSFSLGRGAFVSSPSFTAAGAAAAAAGSPKSFSSAKATQAQPAAAAVRRQQRPPGDLIKAANALDGCLEADAVSVPAGGGVSFSSGSSSSSSASSSNSTASRAPGVFHRM